MSAPPLLDFEALLAPIPGDDPAGAPVPYDVRQQLEEARKEEDPDDYAPDDPTRPQEARRADWAGIVRLAQQTLTGASKDLLVAARLTEALVRLHGFAGLRDGLRLLRELIEQCWDRLYPTIEDGDLEVRAGPFFWLDDADKGARFPNTLRAVPLVAVDGRPYGWLAWRQSQDARGGVTREEFEQAILATPAEFCQRVVEEVAQGHDELNLLTRSLAQVMGQTAPGLTAIRQALDECQALARQIAQRKGPPVGAPAAPDGQPAAGAAAAGPSRAPATRAEVYRQLAQAAALLQELEPHSPIPYLIQRAVELGGLPFPQLIRALIRDQSVLGELNRELGLKQAPPEG
jgi:type VI secretion system protein ImpA